MLEIKIRHLTWAVPKCLICKGTFAIIARLPKYDFFAHQITTSSNFSSILKWFRGKENDQPLSSAILSSMTRKKLMTIFCFPFFIVFFACIFLNIRLPSSIFSPPFHQQDTLNRNSSYTMAKTMANQVWKSTFGGRPQKGRGLSRTSACIHSLCEKKIIPTSNVEKIL